MVLYLGFNYLFLYVHLTGHCVTHAAFKWLWKLSCQNKHKVFFWLLLKGRLSTRELLHRRNMHIQDYSCVFCPSTTDDSLEHLFIHCSFSRACWATIGLQVGDNGQFAILEQLKQQLGVPFFMDIIILMAGAYGCNGMTSSSRGFNQVMMYSLCTSRRNLPWSS